MTQVPSRRQGAVYGCTPSIQSFNTAFQLKEAVKAKDQKKKFFWSDANKNLAVKDEPLTGDDAAAAEPSGGGDDDDEFDLDVRPRDMPTLCIHGCVLLGPLGWRRRDERWVDEPDLGL